MRVRRPVRLLLCIGHVVGLVHGMADEALDALRQEIRDVFYHGYDNYMKHAFPEDELRPLTCAPLTRDHYGAAHAEVNDVLGNYSLTLVDSLSTLALLASSTPPSSDGRNEALEDFQNGVRLLVDNYGDGSSGASGQGARARGFDLDSKVQVFETVIRGVGGLLSAHQFAVGDLPIRGYHPQRPWVAGFVYNGQLLRLATDLANRLMPAFNTSTGLPYPRVNLRHGIPFYASSPSNMDAEHGQCGKDPNERPIETTETCSAGAGSLVLEFSTLSRLTGDLRYERVAKDAFWAVWNRRSTVGLVGAGIDAETGEWINAYTGIGAGIDSFFEYAFKSYILLSGLPYESSRASTDSAEAFLVAWNDAHEDIKRHIYRGAQHHHPHYAQVDLYTGAIRAFWIDSLSAFYQGLLTLAGKLDEAIETHLLYTALWTRYSAMPERWSIASGSIEHGLHWWGGRPEWIESTWYLYQATKDPWYLHAGEMALHDIKRRCWTKCGWAGLQDVRTGELNDRMESFFLGETAKYLFLLFDPSHPLNTWNAPFVFTTEGHPLIIPRRLRSPYIRSAQPLPTWTPSPQTCPLPPAMVPFSISATAARPDIFHAASLARLHLMPTIETLETPLVEFNVGHPSISVSDVQSPSNYTYYPWTLPIELIPPNATSSSIAVRTTFDLSFPNMLNSAQGSALQRVREGILVNSMSGLRLGMVREQDHASSMDASFQTADHFRIYAISNIALGRDEKVFVHRATVENFNPADPYFTRTRDAHVIDLVIDVPPQPAAFSSPSTSPGVPNNFSETVTNQSISSMAHEPSFLSDFLASLQSLLASPLPISTSTLLTPDPSRTPPQNTKRHLVTGTLPVGPGAAPPPETTDPEPSFSEANLLAWSEIHVHPNTLCHDNIPIEIALKRQIIVVPRGDCPMSTKLKNIPSFAPADSSLQLVVIVSFPEHEDENVLGDQDKSHFGYQPLPNPKPLIQPLLDEPQYTSAGLLRPHPISLIMVSGGENTMNLLRHASGVGLRRRYHFRSQGRKIENIIVV